MSHYKFIHFFWSDDLKFQRPIVEMINNTNNFFNPNEHLFLTCSEYVKEAMSLYPNVVLYHNDGRSQAEIINYYSQYGDWLISHSLISHVYHIKRKNLKKIVWRTWGGSRQKARWDKHSVINSIINLCKNLTYYYYYRFSYGCSPVVGIANTVDVIDLEQWNWHKRTKLFFLNYGAPDLDEIVKNTQIVYHKDSEPIKIMVGHQGSQGEHHVEIVKRLLKYKDEKFEIYLPLSYGDKDYINSVKEELISIKDSRIHIMDNFIPFKDYLKFLAEIDVAIIDQLNSMALGNICFLLYFKKKIILNKDGIIKKAFDKEQLPYGLCESIGSMPFPELVSPVHYTEPIQSDIAYHPYLDLVQGWVDLFDYLDRIKGND